MAFVPMPCGTGSFPGGEFDVKTYLSGFCLEDGTPIVIIFQSGVQQGWINVKTTDFTEGPPPSTMVACSGPQGPAGPAGPEGPPGQSGAAGDTYIHDQVIPSDTWIINHNLVYQPQVTTVDSSGGEVLGEVVYMSPTQIIVYFSAAFAGKAYLS